MSRRRLLPLPDYERIYQVIYSVLEASGIARSHRACLFFAATGAALLRKHYDLPATFTAGTFAMMVDEKVGNVAVYGRPDAGGWVHDDCGFHAWIECDGWLVDFMAPIMGVALKEDGVSFDIPRKMLQKRLAECKGDPGEIQHLGEFYCRGDPVLTESLMDNQPTAFADLLGICEAWFRKPPRALPPMVLGDSAAGTPKPLVLHAPTIMGAW